MHGQEPGDQQRPFGGTAAPLELPRFRAAAVQAAPVYLDAQATTDKVCALIREAAGNGAKLVAFPEVFIPGYPYWNWILNPVEGSAWYERLYRNAVDVPGPLVEQICTVARETSCNVVVGINERGRYSLGTIYNTLLLIDGHGRVIGHHRKLVPTWAEKLTWTGGDGSSLKVYRTDIGPLGMLACGENTNTLARFALLSQGELVHVANYISLPVAPPDYDMADAIRLRASAHSFEGKLFTIVSCSTISEEIIAAMEPCRLDARALLTRKSSAFTGVIGPDGRVVGDALIDDEGIVYVDIDLNRCIRPKQMHDIIGHYNRFDVFELTVNKRRLNPVTFEDEGGAAKDEGAGESSGGADVARAIRLREPD